MIFSQVFDRPLTVRRHMSCCKESFTAEYSTYAGRQWAQQAAAEWAKAHVKTCVNMRRETTPDDGDDGHGL